MTQLRESVCEAIMGHHAEACRFWCSDEGKWCVSDDYDTEEFDCFEELLLGLVEGRKSFDAEYGSEPEDTKPPKHPGGDV